MIIQFLFISLMTIASVQASDSYIRNVRPLSQSFFEAEDGYPADVGCGVVALTELMSYWHTERGEDFDLAGFRFSELYSEPDARLNRLMQVVYRYTQSNTVPGLRAAYIAARKYCADPNRPGCQSGVLKEVLSEGTGSVLTPDALLESMKKMSGESSHLNVRSLPFTEEGSWASHAQKIQQVLSEQQPVILFLRGLPPCLSKDESWDLLSWHYLVLVGFDEKQNTFEAISGWKALSKNRSTGAEVHHRVSATAGSAGYPAYVKCSVDELTFSLPDALWFELEKSR